MSELNSFSSDGISGVERFLISHERHGVATPGALEEAVLDLCLRARRDENLLARALKGEDPEEIMESLADDIAKWEEHRDA